VCSVCDEDAPLARMWSVCLVGFAAWATNLTADPQLNSPVDVYVMGVYVCVCVCVCFYVCVCGMGD